MRKALLITGRGSMTFFQLVEHLLIQIKNQSEKVDKKLDPSLIVIEPQKWSKQYIKQRR